MGTLRAVMAAVWIIMGFSAFADANPLDVFKGEKGEIRIAGGTAHIPVMKEAAKQIMEFNPDKWKNVI